MAAGAGSQRTRALTQSVSLYTLEVAPCVADQSPLDMMNIFVIRLDSPLHLNLYIGFRMGLEWGLRATSPLVSIGVLRYAR